MVTRTPRSVFAATHDLPDWRITGHVIEADFRAPSWTAAIQFIELIGAEADRARHHPDVDLRYPGRVRVSLTTHGACGLTDQDADLARAVSAFAADLGATADPLRVERLELAIDALDISAVLPFWRAVLAYVDEPTVDGTPVDSVIDPLRIGPPVWFQQMDEARTQRNRVHVDLRLPHDVAEARIAAAVAAGGTVLTEQFARAFWVLADPEGNEVCVCTWQDRD